MICQNYKYCLRRSNQSAVSKEWACSDHGMISDKVSQQTHIPSKEQDLRGYFRIARFYLE